MKTSFGHMWVRRGWCTVRVNFDHHRWEVKVQLALYVPYSIHDLEWHPFGFDVVLGLGPLRVEAFR